MSSISKTIGKVSQSPTNPHETKRRKKFDVADLYAGPATVAVQEDARQIPLDEKLRQGYFWIVNHAIISPYYDIEFNDGPAQSFTFGDQKSRLNLPSDQSYSSFVLLPLLNLVLRRRCLLVGGPGRGKTASSILMGVLAGYSIKDIKRAIQHGQPQMTISDLLGNPLPSTLVGAKSMDEVQISWRKWLGMRIKIIDEYNRIPTRTQSALLTVMSDNYAEILDQIFECPEAAWYLTANDEAGGGTYQVIEALRDRIDVVVKALHFNTRFLSELLSRIEEEIKPEEVVPPQIIFKEEEIDRAHREILDVKLGLELRRRIEFFTSQFEFCDKAADQIEYKTKDTVKLSGVEFHLVASADTGKDKLKDIGTQTRNGLSVRALMTVLAFSKALSWFRGFKEVAFEDVRQILPFVLHDKLAQDSDSPFFNVAGNEVFRTDKIGWIRRLFDLSCAEYDRLDLDRDDPVTKLEEEFDKGLEGVTESEVRARLVKIERTLAEWSKGRKLYGHMFDDILKLKYLHQRYTNYLKWLQWKS
ncbi:MAG: AAA family ATPase [Blastocatellia bacterium]|nr:AAA family ATPase [Blastocatellia bacterium]